MDKFETETTSQTRKLMDTFKVNITLSDYHPTEAETLQLFEEARERGTAPGTTCKLQFFGDDGVGKTSLVNKLMGKKFDPDIESTFGIETNISQVSSVSAEAWTEKNKNTASEDFQGQLMWFIDKLLETRKNEQNMGIVRWKKTKFVLMFGVLLFLCIKLMGPFWCAFSMISILSIMCLFKRDWTFFCQGLSAATCHMFFQCCEFTCKGLLTETENTANYACFIFSIVGACYGFLMGGQLLPVFIVSWCLLTPDKTSMADDVLSIAPCLPKGTSDSWYRQYALYPGTAIGIMSYSFILHGIKKHISSGNVMLQSQLIQKCLILTSLHIVIFIMLELCRSSTSSVASLLYGISFGIGINFGLIIGRPVLQLSLSSFYPYRYYSSIPFVLLGGVHASSFLSTEISFFKQLFLLSRFNKYYVCRLALISLIIMVELTELYKAVLNPNPVQEAIEIVGNGKREEPKTNMERFSLSKVFHLWDFAGQEFYYNTHQTFIAKHAVCLLIFDLTSFSEERNWYTALNRVNFWLQSISTHTKGPIFLVGTHLDKVTSQHVSILQDFFEKNLRRIQRRFDFNIRYNGPNKPFFVVNNTEQRRDIDDTLNLQTTLSLAADELYPMNTEHPIRWWQFLMFVHEKRKDVSIDVVRQSSLIVNVESLRESFPSIEISELTHILKYFHDIGEIIFDEICHLVCFDPQLLINIMYALTTDKSVQEDGILYRKQIRRIIPNINDLFVERILKLLESKDLICPVEVAASEPVLYLVPFLLPPGYPATRSGTEWDKRFYFDFSEYNPRAVFSRLMARCIGKSQDVVHTTGDQLNIYQNGGLFALSENVTYRMVVSNPSPEQHLIEVSVKVLPPAKAADVPKYLCKVMKELYERDFQERRLPLCGVKCPHMPPHFGCPPDNPHYMHIVPLASSSLTFVEESSVRRLCITEEVCT